VLFYNQDWLKNDKNICLKAYSLQYWNQEEAFIRVNTHAVLMWWLCGMVVRTLDLLSTGLVFDSGLRP